jgi:uncharacterized membrane protein YdbT with pleckstrin-like domain
MSRTSLKHSIPLVAFLMSLALIGWPFIEFIFVTIVTIAIAAVLLYTVLGFFYAVDRILDYFYIAR